MFFLQKSDKEEVNDRVYLLRHKINSEMHKLASLLNIISNPYYKYYL